MSGPSFHNHSQRRRARLGRYFGWQLRDYMLNQGPATAIVMILFGYLSVAPILRSMERNSGVAAVRNIPLPISQALFQEMIASFVLIGTLFATNGIVATDRKSGFYRFYFAKPVSAPRFYTNAFLANGLGLLVVASVLLGVHAVLVRPVFPATVLPVIAAMYLAYGGVGFLLSAIWRFDWLSLVTVAVVASISWELWGDDRGIRGWLVHLLPPTHKSSELYAYVAGLAPGFPWMTLVWLTGYGFACFVAGLIVLRTRSLASP